MQIRYMEQHEPPVRIIVPGPVYRRDNLDLTHTPMFHQIEGLVVGEGITLARPQGHAPGDGRGALRRRHDRALPAELLPVHRAERRSRHRLHRVRRRAAARMCKHTGWLEILGSGMVHPGGVRGRRLRPGRGHRLRLRHGHRARGDAQVGRRRHPPVLRERPALPGAVRPL